MLGAVDRLDWNEQSDRTMMNWMEVVAPALSAEANLRRRNARRSTLPGRGGLLLRASLCAADVCKPPELG